MVYKIISMVMLLPWCYEDIKHFANEGDHRGLVLRRFSLSLLQFFFFLCQCWKKKWWKPGPQWNISMAFITQRWCYFKVDLHAWWVYTELILHNCISQWNQNIIARDTDHIHVTFTTIYCYNCSTLLLVIIVNLLLCLSYKLNFIIGMHV